MLFCQSAKSQSVRDISNGQLSYLENLETYHLYSLKGKPTNKAHSHPKRSTRKKENCPTKSSDFYIYDFTNNSNIFKISSKII